MPFEVEVHTVPHFKAPVNGKVEGWKQEHAGTFTQLNGIVKLGGLVNKMGFDKTEVPMTVNSAVLIFLKICTIGGPSEQLLLASFLESTKSVVGGMRQTRQCRE